MFLERKIRGIKVVLQNLYELNQSRVHMEVVFYLM